MTTERPRLASHVTRTRFLHIEDALDRRKLRLFIGSYEQGRGATATAFTFLDVDDARVVLSDLSWGKQTEFLDFKGGKDDSGGIVSRVLHVALKEGKCWIEVKNGPGEMYNGVIRPRSRSSTTEIQIPLTVFEARRLAHACLAYLAAWDVSCFSAGQTAETRTGP